MAEAARPTPRRPIGIDGRLAAARLYGWSAMETEWPDLVFLPFEADGRVYNPDSKRTYAIAPGRCSCKQYRISGQTCKHLRELYRRLQCGLATWPLQDTALLPEEGTVAAGAAGRAARVRRLVEEEHPDFV